MDWAGQCDRLPMHSGPSVSQCASQDGSVYRLSEAHLPHPRAVPSITRNGVRRSQTVTNLSPSALVVLPPCPGLALPIADLPPQPLD